MAVGMALFEESVLETQDWVEDLASRMEFGDPHYALHGLTAALHALRDELSAEQNAALAAQFPAVLREIYFADWKPNLMEPRHNPASELLMRVEDAFESYQEAPNPLALVESVFEMLEDRISGECQKIRRTLPADLRSLWPE
jgi:uncharacterized protein (DUF2267 family)